MKRMTSRSNQTFGQTTCPFGLRNRFFGTFEQVHTDSDMIDWTNTHTHSTRLTKGAMGTSHNNWWRPECSCFQEKHVRIVPFCNVELDPDLFLFIETVKRTCSKILRNDQLIKHVWFCLHNEKHVVCFRYLATTHCTVELFINWPKCLA